ncbi:MAG: hypothetical protein V7742_21465 [Halioglobus sp.]
MVTILRTTMFLPLLIILSGCLQIELRGPVVGAQVVITNLRTGEVIGKRATTTNSKLWLEVYGPEFWNDWTDDIRLLFLGTVGVPPEDVEDNALYLVTASGGRDMDYNLDREIDTVGKAVARDLHAIMTGAQLKEPMNRVSVLSEAVYQMVSPILDQLNDNELRVALNDYGRRMVGDLNGDNRRDFADVLKWSHRLEESPYSGPQVFVERLTRALESTLYDEEILFYDSYNVVMGARWHAVRQQSGAEDLLAGCAGSITFNDLCRFGELPLLGGQSSSPTVDDIMDRVVVSHPWMGRRFEQMLYKMPADMRLLFRSVATIVIDADIRPAYFNPATASIYLDPEYIWITPNEAASISTEPDFRSEFVSRVTFQEWSRYVDGNNWAFPGFYEPDFNGNRDVDDVSAALASLLFHELAHAGDAIPPTTIKLLSPSDTPYDVSTVLISDRLVDNWPLQSFELYGLADVLNAGKPPSSKEANYSAAQVGALFAPDGASSLYSYFTQYEDAAMLFEEAMMAVHYGFQRDIAFVTPPPPEVINLRCEHFPVGWGSRGRINAAQVLPRTQWVVGEMLPERDYRNQLAGLPGPVLMRPGQNWCDNLFLGPNTTVPEVARQLSPLRLQPQLRYR